MPNCNLDCNRFDAISNGNWVDLTSSLSDQEISDAANGQDSISYGYVNHVSAPGVNSPNAKWFKPPYCTGGDYSGSLVEKSNHRILLEMCKDALKDPDTCQEPWFIDVHGGHGTFAIVLHCERTPDEIVEALEGLDNYPLLNDDDHSQLEWEEEDVAWENWAKDDYKRALEKKFPSYSFDEISDGDLYENFHKRMEETNTYWETEGMGRWVRVESLVKDMTVEDLPESVKSPEGWIMEDDLDGLSPARRSGTMRARADIPAWARPPKRSR